MLFIYQGRAIHSVYGEEHGGARRNTIFLFLMLLFLTVIQETVFGIVDTIVLGTTIARFLPD